MATLVVARQVALYLLSLLAVASADLAGRAPGGLRPAAMAAALGLAVALGALLADVLSALWTAGARRRARLLAFVVLPLPGLFALAAALAAPQLAAPAAGALSLLQAATLLLANALGLELLALWGALLLALVAATAGGLPATVGLTGYLALAGVFIALDHAVRRAAAWPRAPAPALGFVLAGALRMLAVPLVLLAAATVLWPGPSSARAEARPAALTAQETRRAYEWLALVALAGSGTAALVSRLLRGRGTETPPLVEAPESRVEAEELLEPPALDDARYAPARGRVIQAYLRFLARARQAGFRVEAHLTPHEIKDRVRRPEGPLAVLTALFMDARYGPDEPAAETVHRAEAASREACSGLRVLPRGARRRPDTIAHRSGEA